jgi:hypothetical protein
MCTYVWKEAPFCASFIVHSWRHEQTNLFVPPQHYRISLMKRHTNVLWLWNPTLEIARVPIFNYQTWKHPQRMEPNNFHKKNCMFSFLESVCHFQWLLVLRVGTV